MEEEISRMESLKNELDSFLNRKDSSMTMTKTVYKKEAEKLEQYIYEFDKPVTTEKKVISAEKVIFVIKKEVNEEN